MAKKKEVLQPVEASIRTLKRNVDGTGRYKFVIYEEDSNKTLFTSKVYTRRNNSRRGARRYAAKNKYKISRWVK